MLKATIVIPTYNNTKTISYALDSVFQQTFTNYEIVIVGDGVPDDTREILAQCKLKDKKIKFYDNPKGPRHGEIWRHVAVKNAKGDFVAYLSDDDLWMPDHLENLSRLLLQADFVNGLTVCVKDSQEFYVYNGDLSLPSSRRSLLAGHNFMPLSSVAHRMDFYHKLPHGWRTTPENVYTDLYMWQQFLSIPECRGISSNKPSVFNFPKVLRKEMSLEDRCQELAQYLNFMKDPNFGNKLLQQIINFLVQVRVKEVLGGE